MTQNWKLICLQVTNVLNTVMNAVNNSPVDVPKSSGVEVETLGDDSSGLINYSGGSGNMASCRSVPSVSVSSGISGVSSSSIDSVISKRKDKRSKRNISKPYWQCPKEILTDGMIIKFNQPESSVQRKLKVFVSNRDIKQEWKVLLTSRIADYVSNGILQEISKSNVVFAAPISMVPRASDPDRPRGFRF